jgi:rare lipoprotein A
MLLPFLLAACGSTPRSTAVALPSAGPFDTQRDGAPAEPPPGLLERPDPEPRIEPIRNGGPNKPYEVLGQRYTPLIVDEALVESGLASWYGRKFHGRPTASGEVYDMYALSAAHRTMPIPSYARVRNPANGREVVVRINDRGPFHSDRVIDLSYTAALKLGVLRGVTPVQVQRLTHEDIRTGRWRGDTAVALAAATDRPLPDSPAPAQTPVVAAIAPAPAPAPVSAPVTAPPPAPMTRLSPGATDTPAPGGVPRGPEALAQGAALAPPGPAPVAAAPGFWVQLGAFRQRQGAVELRQQLTRELDWLEPLLAIFDERASYRVQAGPYATRSEAQSAAARIRSAASLQPWVLHRR